MIQDFVENQVIRYLAGKPFWTVNINGKKPLDIVTYNKTNVIMGAKNENCLTDLSSLLKIVKAVPRQYVYKLNAVRDGIVVLDIEKTCPDKLKDELLQLPFIYGDVSMSGLGYHLVFPCPQLNEITVNKVAMKEEHGFYEILINHYVSFTNDTIFPQYDTNTAPVQFQEIWDKLADTQKNYLKKSIDIDLTNTELNFRQYKSMKEDVKRHFLFRFKKTVNDYGGDMSRYEFAVISSVRYSLDFIQRMPIYKRVKLDEQQQIRFVYETVRELLHHRAKHDEIRDGKPLLLYQTINNFAICTKSNITEGDN